MFNVAKGNTTVININSVLIAIYLSLTCVVSIIDSFIAIPKISVIISMGIVVLTIICNKNIYINIYDIFIYMTFLFILFVSLIINGDSCLVYLMNFITFATTALILTNVKFDCRIVIRSSIIIYALYIFFFFIRIKTSYLSSENYDVIQMGLAYSFVPGILWAFTLILFPKLCHNNIILSRVVALFIFLGSLYVVLFITITRGAVLIAITGCIFLSMFRLSRKSKRLFVAFVSILLVVVFIKFDSLFNTLLSISANSDVGALSKLYLMSEKGDIGNGRSILFNSAFDIIKKSPFCGMGVGYFEKYNNIYVHQLILQILCEIGIIGLIFFIIPLLNKVGFVLKSRANLVSIIMVILISSTLLMLMFSNVYWLLPNFWFLYFFSGKKINRLSINKDLNGRDRLYDYYSS